MGRFPPRTGDARSDAVAQLRWAMGGTGLTAEKLLRMPDVQALPRVRHATAGLPEPRVPQATYDAVVDAVRQMGSGPRERLFRASLAVDYDGDGTDLTTRRAPFEQLIGRTPRSLYAYERALLDVLVTRLGAPPDDQNDRVPVPAQRPADANGPTAGPWVYEHRSLLYRMAGQAGRSAEMSDVFRATEDGLDRYTLWYYCASGNAAATLTVHWGGVVVDDREDGHPGVRRATVGLPRALAAGEVHEVRYDVAYPPRVEGDTWFAIRAFRATSRITVRVAFDRTRLPQRIWVLDGMPPMAGRGDPDECKPLHADAHGCVECVFTEPVVPLGYGIGWDW